MPYPPEKRNFYRIQYNPANCPFFKFEALNFQVVDLSEEGFSFSTQTLKSLEVSLDMTGSLNFRDGDSFLVHGTILRIVGQTITVKLKHAFSLKKIMAEQRRLIQSVAPQTATRER